MIQNISEAISKKSGTKIQISVEYVHSKMLITKLETATAQRKRGGGGICKLNNSLSMLVLWVVMPCGVVRKYQRFRGTYGSIFRAEDGGSMVAGIYLQVHTALQPRRPTSTSSPS
jgi:hypothetical protein